MSPGGGIIIILLCWESILKIDNLRTRVLPVKTILSFPFFKLQTFKATNQHQICHSGYLHSNTLNRS